MQRVRSDLTVSAAKSVVPGMCFGAIFICIAKCVTENEVNSNKLRDSFEFPLYLSVKCGMIKDRH